MREHRHATKDPGRMNYPLRDQYHRVRKSLLRARDSFIPTQAPSEILTPLVERKSAPFCFEIDAPMPDQALEWAAERKGICETEGLYQALAPCTVDPRIGVLFHNGRVLWGTSDLPERERSPLFLPHRKLPERKLPNAILLHHVYGDNYFHFFMYIMNKVWLVEQHGLPKSIPFLINEISANRPFFQQAQEIGAFFGRDILVQKRNEIIQVDEAYLSLPYFCRGNTMTWIADVFREKAPQNTGKPVFTLRAGNAANGRMFRNQDRVSRLAESAGFELIDPATLTLREQADRFSQAPIIAGAHGAALTNMIFRAGAKTGVLELFSPAMGTPHYAMMAHQLEFEYRSAITENPRGRAFTASTEVNLELLARQFDEMISSMGL